MSLSGGDRKYIDELLSKQIGSARSENQSSEAVKYPVTVVNRMGLAALLIPILLYFTGYGFFYFGATTELFISTATFLVENSLVGNETVEFLTETIAVILSIVLWITIVFYPTMLAFGFHKAANQFVSITYRAFKFTFYAALAFIVLTYPTSFFYDGGGSSTTIISEGSERSASGFTEFRLSIKCDVFEVMTNDDSECLERSNEQNLDQSNTEAKKRIYVNYEFDREFITLDSTEEGFPVTYKFTSHLPIELTQLSCYTNKNTLPYYNSEISDTVPVGDNIVRNLKCENLGSVLEEASEELQLSFELEFKIPGEFTYQIPLINCQNTDIRNYLEEKSYKCADLTIDMINEEFSKNFKLQKEFEGDNSVKFSSLSFDNYLPLHIGDGFTKPIILGIQIEGESSVGEMVSASLSEINLPSSLEYVESSQDQNLIVAQDKKVYAEIELNENDGFSLSENQMVAYQTLTIKTISDIKKKGSSTGKVKVNARFEIQNEETNTSS